MGILLKLAFAFLAICCGIGFLTIVGKLGDFRDGRYHRERR